jgi:UDP-N-acetylglucosamine--dolichyl-phosphate N-acetylglucosaminephosphotransferase
MDLVLFLCFVVSFLFTLLLVPKWIRKARIAGLVGTDMNKLDKPKIPEAGGITVIVGATMGILLYIFLNTFYYSIDYNLIDIFAVLATILLAGLVGFIDDILGWKTGISHTTKILFTIPIAVPLAVVNAGHSVMSLPFIGPFDFGFLFPLVIVPLGIIGATNGYNMLAGYNGLEAGMGIIILATLGFIAWTSGSSWVTMLSLCVVFSLLAFMWFNRPPSRVFPGDGLTYAVGATIACTAILGNMEKFALFLFLPYFFDMLMFIRFRFLEKKGGVEAFAKVNADGSLELPHSKIYDFTHLALWGVKKVKKKAYERDVLVFILGVEAALAVFVVILRYLSLF